MALEIKDRVKMQRKNGGGYEYGTVACVSISPFDGQTLYIVDFEDKSLTLTEGSLIKVKRRSRKKAIQAKNNIK